jgi:putative ABC transport system substrate-binding protein
LSQFLEKLAPTYGVEVVPVPVRSAAEIESTITKVGSAPDHALIVLPDGLAVTHRDLTIELVNRARIPAVYPFRTFALNGKALGLEVPPTLLVLADEVIE